MSELDIDTIPILAGSHDTRDDGVCAMELVAWMAGEPHSDSPACTCPVLAAFVRSWNDGIADDDTRARLLRPFLPRLIGTRSTPQIEEQRAWLATDWLVRVCAPAFLALTPSLREHAEILGGLPPVLSRESARAAQSHIDAARAAARDAARDAAGDAAWNAAGAAAWAAAWNAAGAAAGAAAGDAARAAARAALAETVATLQSSATDLLDRMIRAAEVSP
jgi:hypothetical protein